MGGHQFVGHNNYMYRLYTKVKVSMGFIIPSDEVARLINAIETVPRYITDLYHEMVSHSNKNHAQTCYIKVVSVVVMGDI